MQNHEQIPLSTVAGLTLNGRDVEPTFHVLKSLTDTDEEVRYKLTKQGKQKLSTSCVAQAILKSGQRSVIDNNHIVSS